MATALPVDAAAVALASPLRRPRVARRTAVALAALLLFAALVICAAVGGLGGEATTVFLEALALSSLLSVLPVAILWFLDRRERESPWLFTAAFLWGGLIATTLALPANTAVILGVSSWLEHNAALKEMLGPEAALMIGAPLAAPVVEEVTKGLGIVLLFWLMRAEFDNVRDGFIYGALVGAGFNWFESALYVQQNFVQFGSAPYGFQLGTRYAWLGLAGHAMFSGIFGAALGYARARRRSWRTFLVPLLGLLLAMAAHAWNNALPLMLAVVAHRAGEAPPEAAEPPPDIGLVDAMVAASISNVVIFLPFVLLMVWIIRGSGFREREVIRTELESEVGGAVTADEYRAIVADRGWRTRRIESLAADAARDLVRAQNELAFRKRRLRDRGFDPESDAVVLARRAQIARLRERFDV